MSAIEPPPPGHRPETSLVILVDVDNTLLDNDRIQADIREHLAQAYGTACRDRYAGILEQLWNELGYRDYLGALQRYRIEHPMDLQLLSMSAFLIDYPFAARLYPRALDVIAHLRRFATTVALSDGDVVFQPRKVERAGIAAALGRQVLIYIHKEQSLADVARRFPARHYVMIDDKLRILTAMKQAWGARLTTVFARQGSYAFDAAIVAQSPPADLQVDDIAELLAYDLPRLLNAPPTA